MRKPTKIRKEEIKAAVLDIISSEGLYRLSTRNLAEKVGLSEGTLFRHFKSKKDIFYSIMEDIRSGLQDPLRQIALDTKPAEDRLREFLFTHIRFLHEHKGITILLFSEAAHMNDTKLKLQLQEILMEQKLLAAKIIHDGKAEGKWSRDLRDEDIATLYAGIPLSFNVELVLTKNKVDVDAFCKNMLSLLYRLLR